MKKQSFVKTLSVAAVISLSLAGVGVSQVVTTEPHQTLTVIKVGICV